MSTAVSTHTTTFTTSAVLNSPVLWARHPVRNCLAGVKRFHHPEIGDLEREFSVLQLSDDTGQRVLTYVAVPGTPSDSALRLLASRTGATAAEAVRAPINRANCS